MKILIYGLPGAGKTTTSELLAAHLRNVTNMPVVRLNADDIRENVAFCWDFSEDGRLRQWKRMKHLADMISSAGCIVICDFVCPLEWMRREFNADVTVWVDTIQTGRFEDTNKLFDRTKADNTLVVTSRDISNVLNVVSEFKHH